MSTSTQGAEASLAVVDTNRRVAWAKYYATRIDMAAVLHALAEAYWSLREDPEYLRAVITGCWNICEARLAESPLSTEDSEAARGLGDVVLERAEAAVAHVEEQRRHEETLRAIAIRDLALSRRATPEVVGQFIEDIRRGLRTGDRAVRPGTEDAAS